MIDELTWQNGSLEKVAKAYAADKMELLKNCYNKQLEEGDLIAAFRNGAAWQRERELRKRAKQTNEKESINNQNK